MFSFVLITPTEFLEDQDPEPFIASPPPGSATAVVAVMVADDILSRLMSDAPPPPGTYIPTKNVNLTVDRATNVENLTAREGFTGVGTLRVVEDGEGVSVKYLPATRYFFHPVSHWLLKLAVQALGAMIEVESHLC
jgi:hypothetical protein